MGSCNDEHAQSHCNSYKRNCTSQIESFNAELNDFVIVHYSLKLHLDYSAPHHLTGNLITIVYAVVIP